MIGHLGVERLHPDFDALAVLDHIFGAGPGFTDRLSAVLRDELGLAYSVCGGMTDSADRAAGLFRVYVGTGPDEAPLATAAVLEQVRRPAPRRVLATTRSPRRSTTSAAPGSSTTRPSASAPTASSTSPTSACRSTTRSACPARLARITPDDVRRAARRHLDPDALVRVEYGPIRGGKSSRSECA